MLQQVEHIITTEFSTLNNTYFVFVINTCLQEHLTAQKWAGFFFCNVLHTVHILTISILSKQCTS